MDLDGGDGAPRERAACEQRALKGSGRSATGKVIAKCAWFRREDYPGVLALLVDGERMIPTYAEWLLEARRMERRAAEAGRRLARIYIRTKDFAAWCDQRRRRPSTAELKEYVRTSLVKLNDSLW